MPNRVPQHRPKHLPSRQEQQQYYDKVKRNKANKAFYNSAAWIKMRQIKLNQDPLCELHRERGELVRSTQVHHKIEITVDPSLRLDMDNMQSLCDSCHSRHHAQEG